LRKGEVPNTERRQAMPQWLGRHKWLWLATVAFIALFVFAACGDGEEGETPAAGETPVAGEEPTFGEWGGVVIPAGGSIAVGLSVPLSGDVVALGEAARDAAKLAIQDLGPVQGFPVALAEADDLCDASGALPAAEQLLAEETLVAVLGALCSGVNSAVQPRYEEAHITQISGSSTAPVMTYPEGRDPFQTFVRTVVSDVIQGTKQAEYATEVLEATTAYIAHDTDTYGAGLAEVFDREFTALGGTIAGTQGYEKLTTDFGALVTTIVDANPDMVYVAGFDPEAAPLLTQLRDAGYEGAFMGGDGQRTEQFLTLAGDDAEGAVVSAAAPSPAPQEFQDGFLAFAGYPWDDQPYTSQYYDAMTVVHKALNEVAVLFEGSLYVDLLELNTAIRAQNFDGVSGHIAFDDHGDIGAAPGVSPMLFYKVEGGAFVEQEFE
jgi:branched-chain amino acid transport system substrate-binding protein